MWELYSLSIVNELKTRASLKKLSEFGLDILYARAKTKLWNKIERLRGVPGLSVADFGTRRRHSFLWQEYVVVAMAANLYDSAFATLGRIFGAGARKQVAETLLAAGCKRPLIVTDRGTPGNCQVSMIRLSFSATPRAC